MRIFKIIGLAAVLTLPALAAPITITLSGLATGTAGAASFTNSAFTLTELADTANRQFDPGGATNAQFFINDDSASIAITGLGTFNFTPPLRSFILTNNGNGVVGIGRACVLGSPLYVGNNPALSGWNMTTSVGPFTLTGGFVNGPFQTSGGALDFTANPNMIFQAVVGPVGPGPGPSVPEPASIALLGLGLAGLGLAKYHRRQP